MLIKNAMPGAKINSTGRHVGNRTTVQVRVGEMGRRGSLTEARRGSRRDKPGSSSSSTAPCPQTVSTLVINTN